MAGIYEKQKFPVKIGDMQKWNEIFGVNTFSFYGSSKFKRVSQSLRGFFERVW